MGIWIDFTDATLKDILPSHFKELSYCLILVIGDIAKQVFLRLTCIFVYRVVNYCNRILVISIVQVTPIM